MTIDSGFLDKLRTAIDARQIGLGLRLLASARSELAQLRPGEPQAAGCVLALAELVDAGGQHAELLTELLARFPCSIRRTLPISDYMLLRLSEAFVAIMMEDADTAIDLLDFVLKAREELGQARLVALAHFWKGRSHRKKGEYELALRHIIEARELAQGLHANQFAAVVQIQEAWVLFQKGQPNDALKLFDQAEADLKDADDTLSLANIESSRGRIVRRSGEYAQALDHYQRSVQIFLERDPHHRNLARTLVNAAYVKRLVALQLRKRIDSRATSSGAGSRKKSERQRQSGGDHARYAAICQEALDELAQAGEIYALHQHHTGAGSVLVNAGYLHLDRGDIEQAASNALKAYDIAREKHDHILMARARMLEATVQNVRVDEELGEDGDVAAHANLARRLAEEAVALAKHTQNRRLLAGAWIIRGTTSANDFFQDWEEARQCASRAAALLSTQDRDHIWEELTELKSRILRASGIDETLRAWSEGMVGDKSFQQITEEFAEIVIPKIWVREGKKISRVAERLSISPKKVRRILRNAGLA